MNMICGNKAIFLARVYTGVLHFYFQPSATMVEKKRA